MCRRSSSSQERSARRVGRGEPMSLAYAHEPEGAPRRAHVIVVGNQKGGAGKSTVAMHIVVALMRMGRRTGVLDLDVRQRSLTRYIENRGRWIASRGARSWHRARPSSLVADRICAVHQRLSVGARRIPNVGDVSAAYADRRDDIVSDQ